MGVLEKTLKALKKNQELGIFMRENITDSTEWGFVRDYNKDCFLIDRVSTDGLYDGIIVFQRSQLTRVRWGSSHLNSVAELYKRKNKKVVKSTISIESMHSALQSVQSAYGYVAVSICGLDEDASLLGTIETIDSEYAVLCEFSNKTAKDPSYVLFPLDEITSIQAGGIYEEDIHYLNKEYWPKTRKTKKT